MSVLTIDNDSAAFIRPGTSSPNAETRAKLLRIVRTDPIDVQAPTGPMNVAGGKPRPATGGSGAPTGRTGIEKTAPGGAHERGRIG